MLPASLNRTIVASTKTNAIILAEPEKKKNNKIFKKNAFFRILNGNQ